jgi:DNA helicase-2/ATP-dependent DNA helicase PcrA
MPEATTPTILSPAQLTEPQRAAVEHVDGALLILAGPGSGKTRVVTHRIVHLLDHGAAPHQILALTFTNKAADEMRQRVALLAPAAPVWIGTFHRFCSRLLRRHAALVGLQENFSIYDDGESRQTLASAAEQAGIDLSVTTIEELAAAVSWAKRRLIAPDRYTPRPGNPTGALVARVYPQYQRQLQTANAVDFDDLLMHVGLLLQENPELRRSLDNRYRYILVDEYQDTNLAQYAIVRGLSIDYPNLAVTGDPDQCIYGWRGANLSNILDFERDFPQVRVVRLEQNYRSTPNILSLADQLIAHNTRRKPKRLFTDKPPGRMPRLVVYASSKQEAEDIAGEVSGQMRRGRRPRDFAIFYRTNAVSRMLEEAFVRQGVPYQIVNGHEFYERREVKDMLAYMHLINNPRHDAAFRRVINTPPRGIGRTTVKRLDEHARRYQIPLLEAAREAGLMEGLNKRAAGALSRFVALYDALHGAIQQPVAELARQVLTESGYRERLARSQNEEDQERLANVEELIAAAQDFDLQHSEDGGLEAFLEQAALVADTDTWEQTVDKVSLMTLHSAKGLEFPVVYIVGLEEGLLPHERSRHEPDKLEEERRLLFVGITRAQEELQMSMARRRAFRGDFRPTVPSTFLLELPREEIELIEHPPEWGTRRSQAPSFEQRWDDDFDDVQPESEEAWEFEQFDPDAARGEGSNDDVHAAPRGTAPPGGPARDDPRPRERNDRAARLPAAVRTAAEMLGESPQPTRRPVEAFQLGMLVRHPEYGPGKIVEISGSGLKRSAAVNFFGGAGCKKFRLAFSPLEPITSPS